VQRRRIAPQKSGKTINHSSNVFGSAPRLALGLPMSNALSLTSPDVSQTDVITSLRAALDHVQTLRVQKISRTSIQLSLYVTPNLARPWIESTPAVTFYIFGRAIHKCQRQPAFFFFVQPVGMSLGFVDVRLIKLVPDLINMPDVTLKPVIHVLYHSILHYGSCMPKHYAFQDEDAEVDYPTLAYIGALRALPM